MSEVKTGYMAELDAWSDKSLIEPLADAYLRGPEEVIINAQKQQQDQQVVAAAQTAVQDCAICDSRGFRYIKSTKVS